MDLRLTDRAVIVTGAAQGIGREYARGFARAGARLILNDLLDPAPAADEARDLGAEAVPFRGDVSDEVTAERLIGAAVERFGRLDVLVNNAALYGGLSRGVPSDTISVAEWDRVMAVNVRGVFLCCRAALPVMRTQRSGKIINISSSTVFTGVTGFLHYVTSKGAVLALTRALAREVGRDGICVNAVAPGYTMSEANRNNEPAIDAVQVAGRCLPRTEVPADLVGTVLFLASPLSEFVTGQTLVVDGGLVMH